MGLEALKSNVDKVNWIIMDEIHSPFVERSIDHPGRKQQTNARRERWVQGKEKRKKLFAKRLSTTAKR